MSMPRPSSKRSVADRVHNPTAECRPSATRRHCVCSSTPTCCDTTRCAAVVGGVVARRVRGTCTRRFAQPQRPAHRCAQRGESGVQGSLRNASNRAWPVRRRRTNRRGERVDCCRRPVRPHMGSNPCCASRPNHGVRISAPRGPEFALGCGAGVARGRAPSRRRSSRSGWLVTVSRTIAGGTWHDVVGIEHHKRVEMSERLICGLPSGRSHSTRSVSSAEVVSW